MKIENRRRVLSGLGFVSLLGLGGCEKATRSGPIAAGQVNTEQVHLAMKALLAAVGDLASGVERFDTENWRNVVGDVKIAASKVSGASINLREALGYSDAQ